MPSCSEKSTESHERKRVHLAVGAQIVIQLLPTIPRCCQLYCLQVGGLGSGSILYFAKGGVT